MDRLTVAHGEGVVGGVEEGYKANNIYNLLGNVFEYTLEKVGEARVMRGGAFTAGFAGCSVTDRVGIDFANRHEHGFRSAIWKDVPAE